MNAFIQLKTPTATFSHRCVARLFWVLQKRTQSFRRRTVAIPEVTRQKGPTPF